MPNALLIYGAHPVGFEGSISAMVSKRIIFTVTYVVFKKDVDINWMKLGMALKDMLDGSVVEYGQVRAPDGSPPDNISMGSMAIESQNEALEIACAALANPNSEIRAKGFSKNSPIYLWQDGKPAQLLECKEC